jgi:hypothetical protein
VTDPKTPKKTSAWWAIIAALLLVGTAAWYETQYRALSKPGSVQPTQHAAPRKAPDGQPGQKQTPTKQRPSETGLLIG